jgi:DNA modification methylase
MDIDPGKTLQFRSVREDADEKHICPLQLQVIERGLELWSNPGDLVLSPFAGIGSEGYCALRMGRKFVGIELAKKYYDQSVANLNRVEEEKAMDLFAKKPEDEAEPQLV